MYEVLQQLAEDVCVMFGRFLCQTPFLKQLPKRFVASLTTASVVVLCLWPSVSAFGHFESGWTYILNLVKSSEFFLCLLVLIRSFSSVCICPLDVAPSCVPCIWSVMSILFYFDSPVFSVFSLASSLSRYVWLVQLCFPAVSLPLVILYVFSPLSSAACCQIICSSSLLFLSLRTWNLEH